MGIRICLLTETYSPVVGGGETQARLLAEGLVEKGFDVQIVTRRSSADLARRELVGGVPVSRLPPTGSAHLNKWGLLASALVALRRRHRTFDLLLVSGFRVLGIAAVLGRWPSKKPCILKADSLGEMSGEFFRGGLRRLGLDTSSRPFRHALSVRNRLLRRADRFVAISSVIRDELVAHGVAADRITSIPNAVDLNRFRPAREADKPRLRSTLGLPATARLVVYTGRLVSYKGLPLLLRVWRELATRLPDPVLVLVGSGGLDIHDCEDALRRYVHEHHLEERVRFAGAVSTVEAYLRAADVFVFPTENEAFGISVIEAMACGLAVVSTQAGGLGDIVEDQVNAVVVPTGDEARLLEALLLVLEDDQLAKSLGRRARQSVAESYGREAVVERYSQVVRELTAATPTPSR